MRSAYSTKAAPVVVVGQSAGVYGGGRNDYALVEYATVPALSIRRTVTNTVAVSWPSPSAGFHLQQNTNIIGTNWILAGAAASDDGTNKTFIVNPPAGYQFYRLIYP